VNWDSENIIRKIFYKKIRNSVFPVKKVKYLESGSNVIKTAGRAVAPAAASVGVKQHGTETDIHPDVRFNDSRIPVLHASGNIVRQIGTIQCIKIDPEIFIG
jgi:hypothetical protein